LIQKLEKIELPNQMVAVIGDPLLQKFLQLKSSNNISERIDNWLLAFFEDQLQSPDSENAVLDMLERIRDFTRYTKVLPPACLTYLLAMMDSWNGVTGRQVIFDLLAYTPIAPFEG
jgi:centromere protein I